jgi:Notch-like protein
MKNKNYNSLIYSSSSHLKTFLPCLTNPCLNNGTCSASTTGTVQCNCTKCYSGSLCQTPDYCCLQVCSPNGICISGVNSSYLCICQPNYVGVNCTTFNPCAVLPCLNNGKLIFEEKFFF